jgi:large subunit ribosomal protein L29
VKVAELRVLEADELNGRLRTARRELYELRFKHAVGQLENSSEIAKVRHDIARIMTVLSERELGIEVVTETPEEAPASVRKGPARKEFEDEEPEGEEAAASAEAEPAEPVMEEPVEEAPKPKRGRKSKEEKS